MIIPLHQSYSRQRYSSTVHLKDIVFIWVTSNQKRRTMPITKEQIKEWIENLLSLSDEEFKKWQEACGIFEEETNDAMASGSMDGVFKPIDELTGGEAILIFRYDNKES
jgi:hypothetical protein